MGWVDALGGGGIGGVAFWWPGTVNSALLNGFTVLFVFSILFSLHTKIRNTF